ncbi:MarR family transcriptional regulator [Pseudalkalibacillus hwajinpoensis]|uniref:MarR family winged helix-turn-helix transcriptional regulator n=1 Tax=Guptibacillus hwajinpoensis TaxID=208199 RepID=UPI00325B6295
MDNHSIENIHLELSFLIRYINLATPNKKDKEGNLERSEYLLLHQISLHTSIGVKVLANELYLNNSTVSRQAAALEKKGFVTKIADPRDGRSYFYQITELGTKELLQYKQTRMDIITTLLNEWSEEECQTFEQLLNKFNHSLKEIV